MAGSLIKSMTGKFNIGDFKDTYTTKLMKLIRAKATGKKLPPPKADLKKPANDLIEQLQLSLSKPGAGGRKKK